MIQIGIGIVSIFNCGAKADTKTPKEILKPIVDPSHYGAISASITQKKQFQTPPTPNIEM